jgi:PAS domain S-box-containing protein
LLYIGARKEKTLAIDKNMLTKLIENNSTKLRWSGPLVVAVVLLLLELGAAFVIHLPNPNGVFLVAVVYAAFVGGLKPGLVGGGLTLVYVMYYFSQPGQLFSYTADDAVRVGIQFVTTPLMVVMVGILREHLDRKIAALQQREQQYHSIVQALAEGLVVQDATGAIISCNPSAEQILGLTADQLAGRSSIDPHWRAIREDGTPFPGDQHPAMETLRTGQSFRDIIMGVHKPDGTLSWLSVNSQPIFAPGEATKAIAVVATFVDITQRKRTEARLQGSEARFQSFMRHLPAMAWICDEQGHLSFANGLYLELMKLTGEFTPGRNLSEMVPEDHARQYLANNREVFETGEILVCEENYIHQDGSPRTGLSFKFLLDETGETGLRLLGGLAIDITERKHIEEHLRVLNLQLARSNRELEDFAIVASHDLQEPLRKVIVFGDLLRDEYKAKLDEQGQDYLNRMQNAARRMQTLIKDLLTFSRISTKAQPFERVDLNRLTEEVLADLEVPLQQSGAKLEIADLPVLEADPTQMRQLMQNLISNALKFRLPNVPPQITISGRALAETNMYEIRVEDNGIGFDEKYLDRIFGVFQRLHGKNSSYEGTGIGLAICRKIIERHNGSITARSRSGKGAIFIVTLPNSQARSATYYYD